MTQPWLIGCEYSSTVRGAFAAHGIPAYSCDIIPTEGDPRFHIVGDVQNAITSRQWAGIILHVPCTAMGVCGNGTYGAGKARHGERIAAIAWTLETWRLAKRHARAVALENPASVIFPILRADGADVQYVQPWQHGHPEQKKTGLALHNLPRLVPTRDVYAHMMTLPRAERERVFFMSPGPDRGKERARFFAGFANAMAEQWIASLEQREQAA